MAQWFLKLAIKFVINYLLNQFKVEDVLKLVRNAEAFSDNDMSKRASVYREVKKDVGSTLVANLVTELAVYLQKRVGVSK